MTQTVAEPTIQKTQDLASILDKTYAIWFQTSTFGNSTKLPSSSLRYGDDPEEQPDPDMMRAMVKLLDSKKLDAIKANQEATRRWLRRLTVPSPMKDSIYLLPKVNFQIAEEGLAEFLQTHKDLVLGFMPSYGDAIVLAKNRLRSAFNPMKYPAPDVMEARFIFQWEYVSFGTPDSLPERFRQREEAKAAARISSLVEDINVFLYMELKELAEHMVERLHVEPGKPPKTFRDNLVTGIDSVLQLITTRNITGNEEIANLASEMSSLVRGYQGDVQTLRYQMDARNGVAQAFKDITEHLDELITEVPTRKITIRDRSEEA